MRREGEDEEKGREEEEEKVPLLPLRSLASKCFAANAKRKALKEERHMRREEGGGRRKRVEKKVEK